MQNEKKDYRKKILTIPNVLSMFRIMLIPLIIWLYLTENAWWTAITLTVSGLTDIVDGFIARRFDMVSDFGKAFDPVADKLTQFSMLVCLVAKNPLIAVPLSILVVKEITTGILGLVCIKKTGVVKSAVWHGKLNTCLLYALMILHLLWIDIPETVSLCCIAASSCMMLFSFVLYCSTYIKALWRTRK